MRARRACGNALGLLIAAELLLAGCGTSEGKGSTQVQVSGPGWTFTHLPVVLELTPKSALAGRGASWTVAVGSDVVGRWESDGKKTRISIPSKELRAGVHRVLLKTGSVKSELTVRIVPLWWLGAPVAGLVLGLFLLRRRRRAA